MALSFSRLLLWAALIRRTPDPRPSVVLPPEGPAAPSDLVATAVSPTQVDLTWTDNSNNETGFPIRRGLGTGPGFTDPVGIAPADATGFSDVEVSPDTTYFYTIHAINDFGASGIDGPASDTTPPISVTLHPDFYGPPAGALIEEQVYNLRARVRNPDETIHTVYAAADWEFAITVGGSFGSIGGANNDVLTINAGTGGNSITVQATYVGSETLNPLTDTVQFSINVLVPGEFNEPPNSTTIINWQGSPRGGNGPSGQAFGLPFMRGWEQIKGSIDQIADATNPTGSGQVLRFRYAVGAPGGAARAHTPASPGLPGAPYRTMYLRFRIFHEPGWVDSKKFFYLTQTNYTGDNGSPNGGNTLVRFNGPTSQGTLSVVSSSNPDLGSTGADRFPVRQGQWQTFEYVMRRSLPSGATNASVSVWVDGVLVATKSNMIMSPVSPDGGSNTGFDYFTWRADNNQTTVESFYRLGELYLSGSEPCPGGDCSEV